MLTRRLIPSMVVGVILWGLVHFSSPSGSDHPRLDQACQAIRAMAASANLTQSAFPYVCPESQPSQWVSYFFSTLGTAEWPPTEGLEFTAEEARVARIKTLPSDVAIVPLRPLPRSGKQLVLSYDDARGVIIADAYESADRTPVFRREWPLPQVRASTFAIDAAESNLELGMGYQADLESWGRTEP
jgi:hypothetical protein